MNAAFNSANGFNGFHEVAVYLLSGCCCCRGDRPGSCVCDCASTSAPCGPCLGPSSCSFFWPVAPALVAYMYAGGLPMDESKWQPRVISLASSTDAGLAAPRPPTGSPRASCDVCIAASTAHSSSMRPAPVLRCRWDSSSRTASHSAAWSSVSGPPPSMGSTIRSPAVVHKGGRGSVRCQTIPDMLQQLL